MAHSFDVCTYEELAKHFDRDVSEATKRGLMLHQYLPDRSAYYVQRFAYLAFRRVAA